MTLQIAANAAWCLTLWLAALAGGLWLLRRRQAAARRDLLALRCAHRSQGRQMFPLVSVGLQVDDRAGQTDIDTRVYRPTNQVRRTIFCLAQVQIDKVREHRPPRPPKLPINMKSRSLSRSSMGISISSPAVVVAPIDAPQT